jgi:outer membrane protein OmpA-like peptidoglycan-associated protein
MFATARVPREACTFASRRRQTVEDDVERTTITMTDLRTGLAAGLLTAGLLACSSSTQSHELRDARQAYNDAESSPAAKRAPKDLEAARRALSRAEQVHKENPGSKREASLAEIAEHKADLAKAHGELADANHETAEAKVEAREDVAKAKVEARQDVAEAERDTAEAKATARKEAAQATRDLARDKADETRRAGSAAASQSSSAKTEAERERANSPTQRELPATSVPRKEGGDPRATAALQNLAQVANVKQEPRGIVITLSGSLLFPTGKEQLSPSGRQSMDKVADTVAKQPADSKLQVEGYTDDSGSKAHNERLSGKRAQAVADRLVERGIDAKRIEVIGRGESRPIASNNTEEGRALNRRVEIVIAAPGREPLASNRAAGR